MLLDLKNKHRRHVANPLPCTMLLEGGKSSLGGLKFVIYMLNVYTAASTSLFFTNFNKMHPFIFFFLDTMTCNLRGSSIKIRNSNYNMGLTRLVSGSEDLDKDYEFILALSFPKRRWTKRRLALSRHWIACQNTLSLSISKPISSLCAWHTRAQIPCV